jgi:N-acetylglucosaminyl-diphospho-decaprenol L-rhamnosyltransferase
LPDCSPTSPDRLSAVVVDYNAGEALVRCVKSLLEEGVGEIVVVDNASVDGSADLVSGLDERVRVLRSEVNLGYGAGANFGARSTGGDYFLVTNPDLVVVPGAVGTLAAVLDRAPDVAMAGPMLLDTDLEVYPSGREFPSIGEALGHAFLGLVWGGNPWTRRYRHIGPDQHVARPADWVSGALFLARRLAWDSVGGFDESYFMYVEDVDLCWRLRRAGWEIAYEPSAKVVHEQGRSASRHPYRMLLAHHRSMWRFAARSARGGSRLLLPLVAIGLVVRLVLAWAEHLLQPRERLLHRHGAGHSAPGPPSGGTAPPG